MNQHHRIFILNEVFTMDEIATVAATKLHQNLTDWEFEFYSFVREWFNENDFVEVKTSGSTGLPKTIRLSKLMMQKSALRTILYFGLEQNAQLLLSLSCRYIAGKMMVVRAFTGNMNLTIVDPSTNFDFLDKEEFDFGALVPLQVGNVLQSENGATKLENIKNLLVGGSAVPSSLEQQIRTLKSNVVSSYGMTETASHVAIRGISAINYSENYHCLQGVSIRKNQNECLEIFVEGFADWLLTTDLVELISDSEFKIIGRADHAIISGGLKFHPEKLEKKLENHIRQPFIISSEPDEKLGQKLILIIECDFSKEKEDELKNVIIPLLPIYERPRKIVFVGRLPRNESGKIVRK